MMFFARSRSSNVQTFTVSPEKQAQTMWLVQSSTQVNQDLESLDRLPELISAFWCKLLMCTGGLGQTSVTYAIVHPAVFSQWLTADRLMYPQTCVSVSSCVVKLCLSCLLPHTWPVGLELCWVTLASQKDGPEFKYLPWFLWIQSACCPVSLWISRVPAHLLHREQLSGIKQAMFNLNLEVLEPDCDPIAEIPSHEGFEMCSSKNVYKLCRFAIPCLATRTCPSPPLLLGSANT